MLSGLAATVGSASDCTASATAFAGCLSRIVINPLLLLLFTAALLLFIYGIVEYIWELSINGKQNSNGKQHMLWGLIGMFIMAAAFTIIKIVANTFNVSIPG